MVIIALGRELWIKELNISHLWLHYIHGYITYTNLNSAWLDTELLAQFHHSLLSPTRSPTPSGIYVKFLVRWWMTVNFPVEG